MPCWPGRFVRAGDVGWVNHGRFHAALVSIMRPSSTASRQPTLAVGDAERLHLVEPARRDGEQAHEAGRRSTGERTAREVRAQAISDLVAIVGFQAEVFDPALRCWVPGFAVHSEFPRPSAKALHAAALRRRGLANKQIAEVLHVKRHRVSLLAWRGDGFLSSLEGSTGYEEARRAIRCRL